VARDTPVKWQGLGLQLPPSRRRSHYVKTAVRLHEYPRGQPAVFWGPPRLADGSVRVRASKWSLRLALAAAFDRAASMIATTVAVRRRKCSLRLFGRNYVARERAGGGCAVQQNRPADRGYLNPRLVGGGLFATVILLQSVVETAAGWCGASRLHPTSSGSYGGSYRGRGCATGCWRGSWLGSILLRATRLSGILCEGSCRSPLWAWRDP
jgi:hypothetical protein